MEEKQPQFHLLQSQMLYTHYFYIRPQFSSHKEKSTE